MNSPLSEQGRVRRIHKELIAFIGITFFLTYAYNLWLILAFGTIDNVPPYSTLVQMMIPALVAIFCICIFCDQTLSPSAKLFFALVFINAAVFLWEMGISPIVAVTLFEMPIYRFMPTFSIIVSSISILILIVMNIRQKSREELYPAGLSFGHGPRWYVIIPVLFGILFFSVYFLNHIFNSGNPIMEFSLEAFTAALFINLCIGFLVGWQFYFGEEYGWRIYLQDRLFTILGGLKGVIVIGVLWGLWHSGLILMGMNYPGQPILGNSIMILFAIVMGVFYSIAVLKTGSVWIAVILHLITDTMEPLAWLYLSYPSDMIYSFGTGIYGVAILSIIAIFLLLRLDIWGKASTLVAQRLSGHTYDHKHVHTGSKDV